MKKIFRWVIIVVSVLLVYIGLVVFIPKAFSLIGIQVGDGKTMVDALKSFTETVAIVVAGIWTYGRFIKTKEETREDYPYPKIEQRCEHYVLESNIVYLAVFVTVTNQGKTKLDLDGAHIIVRQVSPLSKEIKELITDTLLASGEDDVRLGKVESLFIDNGQRVGWLTLGYRDQLGQEKWKEKINELEPGQAREFRFDFLLLEDDVQVVDIVSYFIGRTTWELATLYPLF